MDYTEIGKHLGQKSSYVTKYDPSLLVKAPRQANRTVYGVTNGNLPFMGYDVWNNYEVSCLLDNGMPVTALAKIVYPCESEYIVESKSLKLYWNGFNVTKMGSTTEKCYQAMEDNASHDLSKLLGTDVKVVLVPQYTKDPVKNCLYTGYENIDSFAEDIQTGDQKYKIDANLLKSPFNTTHKYALNYKFYTTVLRSLCQITSQPDSGQIFIHYKGKIKIDYQAIMKYIVSHREYNQFHEPTAEHIYMDLYNEFKPEELAVFCLYNRRGSLDINPLRASHSYLIPNDLVNPNVPWVKTSSQ